MRAEWSYQFAAVKESKGLVFLSRAFFDRAISTLGDGEELVVTVAKKQDRRTSAQNRLIWGTTYTQILEGLADEVGYDKHDKDGKDKLHEGLCLKYAGTVKDPATGQDVRKFRSSKATKLEFTRYVEWVARFSAEEYGVVIALPGDL